MRWETRFYQIPIWETFTKKRSLSVPKGTDSFLTVIKKPPKREPQGRDHSFSKKEQLGAKKREGKKKEEDKKTHEWVVG